MKISFYLLLLIAVLALLKFLDGGFDSYHFSKVTMSGWKLEFQRPDGGVDQRNFFSLNEKFVIALIFGALLYLPSFIFKESKTRFRIRIFLVLILGCVIILICRPVGIWSATICIGSLAIFPAACSAIRAGFE
jgi:hypothetical protein